MCPNERWFNSKGVTHFTPTSIFILCVHQWVFIRNLTCASPPDLTLWYWNIWYFITVLLDCHLQAHVWPHTCHLQSLKPGRNHISLLLLGFLPRSLYDWLRHFRTLVKWQWCSQVMMVMETGVITHTIVNENTQLWMGFCALFFRLFFKPWLCLFQSQSTIYLNL